MSILSATGSSIAPNSVILFKLLAIGPSIKSVSAPKQNNDNIKILSSIFSQKIKMNKITLMKILIQLI